MDGTFINGEFIPNVRTDEFKTRDENKARDEFKTREENKIRDENKVENKTLDVEIGSDGALDRCDVLNIIHENHEKLLEFNSVCFYLPMFILITINIWTICIAQLIEWPMALFLNVVTFIVVYMFSIGYRNYGEKILDSNEQLIKDKVINLQLNKKVPKINNFSRENKIHDLRLRKKRTNRKARFRRNY
jgi:hypothetical protein